MCSSAILMIDSWSWDGWVVTYTSLG